MAIYKGYEIIRTGTTTGGHDGKPLRNIHLIGKVGVHAGSADVRDHGYAYRLGLTSVKACKEYINEKIEA
jgi:hypothetical protein